jgi:hypothetical protein
MAKRKKNVPTVEKMIAEKPTHEPKMTRAGFQITTLLILLGLAAEVVIALIVSPRLPAQVPSWWVGQLVSGETVPAWTVYVVFPLAQAILFLVGWFSPKDADGRKVMESGKAWTLILLALLFVALQASAFNLGK